MLIFTFTNVGTLFNKLESTITTTLRSLRKVEAMPYPRETSILFFWFCRYNWQNTLNEWNSVFADAGDWVYVKIPQEVCAATDSLRVFCCIVKRSRPKHYQLRTSYGLLTIHYAGKTILCVPPAAGVDLEIIIPPLPAGSDDSGGASSWYPAVCALFQKNIRLHVVEALESHSTSVGILCNYKGICPGRCWCNKNQPECSIHCDAD